MSLLFKAWRSDQLSQATSSVVNKTGDGWIELRRRIKRKTDGQKDRGQMGACYFHRCLAKVKLITISSEIPNWREVPFNILALVSEDKFSPITTLFRPCGEEEK